MRASASWTSNNRRSKLADAVIYDPRVAPIRFQRVPKTPGSRKLVNGAWITVKHDDDDVILIGTIVQQIAIMMREIAEMAPASRAGEVECSRAEA